MEVIATEFRKFTKKHKDAVEKTSSQMQSIHTLLQEGTMMLQSDPASASHTFALLSSNIKDLASQTIDEQKEVHSNLSKCGKAIDKKFSSFDLCWDPKAFDGKQDVLNTALAMHFVRQGRFDLAKNFIREAKLDMPENLNNNFIEMYQIIEAIRQYNLEPALVWAEAHRSQLAGLDSSLEFNLHKLRYLQLLTSNSNTTTPIAQSNSVRQALDYAQNFFGRFAVHHMKEIQRLSCAILFHNRISESVYADLLSPSMWFDVQNQFTREFCTLLGLSPESPLFISVLVGTTALPIIVKMSQIMKETKNEWTSANELPVEIPLHPSQRYHSIFACPVSREQGTEENPPMMMICGHVICKESLMRLGKGNGRFKCPYCPSESTQNQAKQIYL